MKIFFIDMLEMAIPISMLIGIMLLISPLIKKSYVAKWRYFMWLFIAVRLIFPFKINILQPAITMELPETIYGIPTVTDISQTAVHNISIQKVMIMTWITGMIIFAIYQIFSYFSFGKSIKRWAQPVTDKRIIRFFMEIKEQTGKKQKLDIKMCKIISTPMVFGIIRPVLLLPKCNYSDIELKVILSHELVHFKRNDILYKLILTAANCINWFNPLVYIMIDAANKDIELVCDSEVVRDSDMGFRYEYCNVILNMIHCKKVTTAPLSTCFIISKKVMKERFSQILDTKEKHRGIIMFAVVMVSAIISGSIITFAAERVAGTVENKFKINDLTAELPASSPTNAPSETTVDPSSMSNGINESLKSENSHDVIKNNDDNYSANNESYNDSYTMPDNKNNDSYLVETENNTDIPTQNIYTPAPQSDSSEYIDISENAPDSISIDGSKETYNISDEKTVILQYGDNNEFDTGYIIVK